MQSLHSMSLLSFFVSVSLSLSLSLPLSQSPSPSISLSLNLSLCLSLSLFLSASLPFSISLSPSLCLSLSLSQSLSHPLSLSVSLVVFSYTCVITTFSQILTGTGEGNLFVWDGGQSLHTRHLVQFEEAHDLAVLALQFAPVTTGKRP
jgi:hypothetical protein